MLEESMEKSGGNAATLGFLSHKALPETEKRNRQWQPRCTLFQCSAEAYCWQVAPQQSLLPLRLLCAKLIQIMYIGMFKCENNFLTLQ